MSLTTYSFDEWVSRQVAIIQAQSNPLMDFNEGAILLSQVEANASVALWQQALVIGLLAITRLGTSTGTDIDTFVNPFGMIRTPASPAEGLVNFARFTPTTQALIFPGAQVSAPDAVPPQTFSVIIDTNNPDWDAGLEAYVLQAGITDIDIPVQADVAGIAGNVSANLINTLDSNIIGVNTVNNAEAFTDGTDQQSDSEVIAAFPLFLEGLAKGTIAALTSVIVLQFPEVTRFKIIENKDYPALTTNNGQVVVVIDDGSGAPPSDLITNVYNALYLVRAAGIRIAVYGPSLVEIDVAVELTIDDTETEGDVEALVLAALQTYIEAIPFGGTLYYSKLFSICYGASTAITNVSNLLLDGATADVTSSSIQLMTPDTIDITFS